MPAYDAGTADSADGAYRAALLSAAGGGRDDAAERHRLPAPARGRDRIDGRRGEPVHLRRPADRPLVGQPVRAVEGRRHRPLRARQPGRPAARPGDAGARPSRGSTTAARGCRRTRRIRGAQDSTAVPDVEGPLCAGSLRDPFPSATVYVVATFVDPVAEHWDPKAQKVVVGPVTSKVFYQFAGVRDLAKLGKSAAATPGRWRRSKRPRLCSTLRVGI